MDHNPAGTRAGAYVASRLAPRPKAGCGASHPSSVSWPALLNRDGHLTPELTVTIVEQVAAALDAAHEQGLVHRDVKPSNLLITADEFVYLIDFGIARGEAAPKLTYTGSILGTWGYMAPERFTDGTNDACVDIYALACVLYECLTGQLPFPGETLEQQFTGHTTQDPPRPTDVKPELPAGFRRGDRPGFGQESRPALPHRPGTGRRGSQRRRNRGGPTRHPTTAAPPSSQPDRRRPHDRPHRARRHGTGASPGNSAVRPLPWSSLSSGSARSRETRRPRPSRRPRDRPSRSGRHRSCCRSPGSTAPPRSRSAPVAPSTSATTTTTGGAAGVRFVRRDRAAVQRASPPPIPGGGHHWHRVCLRPPWRGAHPNRSVRISVARCGPRRFASHIHCLQ